METRNSCHPQLRLASGGFQEQTPPSGGASPDARLPSPSLASRTRREIPLWKPPGGAAVSQQPQGTNTPQSVGHHQRSRAEGRHPNTRSHGAPGRALARSSRGPMVGVKL